MSQELVGRQGQIARLGDAFDLAWGGRASVVLVRGEAGVGKSRLLREFLSASRSRGATPMFGGCVDVSACDLPYVPFRAAFRLLLEERGTEEMAQLLGPTMSDLHVLLPDLAPTAGPAAGPSGGGRHVFEAVSSVVATLAREACVVLAVDDAQWADVSTLQLLRYLTQHRAQLRLLLVVAYRGEELPQDALWQKAFEELNRSAVELVDVPPLDPAEVLELVTSLRGDMPDATVARVVSVSDGLPFLVEELVAAERDGISGGIPSRFAEALRLRVAALPGPARGIVELLAAAGRPSEGRTIATASGLTRRDFATAVSDALQARVLVEDPDRRTYGFRHDLVREIVYRDLRAATRSDLHARLAVALEAQLPARPHATQLGEVSHHWLQTDDEEAGMLASLRAARASTDAHAHPEAARHYDQVIALWPHVRSPEALSGIDDVTLLTEAAEASHWAGQTDVALRHVSRALREVDREHDERVSGLHERMRLYSWLDTGHLDHGPERDQITATATRERMRASDLMQSGRYFESIQAARQALRLGEAAHSASDEIRASIILGVGLAMCGSVDEGVRTINDTLAEAIGHGSPEEVIAGHVNLAFILFNDGQMEESARVALAGIDEAVKRGAAAVDGAILAANAAAALLRLGRLLEADRVVQEAGYRGPSPTGASMLLLIRAEIDVVRGRLDEAEVGLREILRAMTERRTSDVGPAVLDDYQFRGQMRLVEAELQLWSPSPGPTVLLGDVRRLVGSDIARLDTDDDVLLASRLCWLGVRSDADAASFARVTGAQARIDELVADGAMLAERVRGLTHRTLGDGTRRHLEATLALLEAERSRLRDDPLPELWRECSQTWEMEPYLHAYCLWRLGSALRAVRRRSEAADALREAYRIAASVGMRGLVEVTLSAGIALGVSLDKAAPQRKPERPAHPFNLTAKEMEVLRLLVAGGTNRRIASTLFMTEKTASVHVSHILAKLSVTSRGEAIARAYELGLARPDAQQG